MKTLYDMQEEIVHIFKEYDKQGTKTWDYVIASHDLQYQTGNLTKCILQLTGHRYKEGKDVAQIKEKIKDELADIMAETFFIAKELDIDLYEAWEAMVQSDKNKIEDRS